MQYLQFHNKLVYSNIRNVSLNHLRGLEIAELKEEDAYEFNLQIEIHFYVKIYNSLSDYNLASSCDSDKYVLTLTTIGKTKSSKYNGQVEFNIGNCIKKNPNTIVELYKIDFHAALF